MIKSDETWVGSILTEGITLDELKERRDLYASWGYDELVELVTNSINYRRFFLQVKDLSLFSYQFDTWPELTGVLYDSYITVSSKVDYESSGFEFCLLRYEGAIVGYAVRVKQELDYLAHVSSRFEIKNKT